LSIYSPAVLIGSHISQSTKQEKHVEIWIKVSFVSIFEVSRLTLIKKNYPVLGHLWYSKRDALIPYETFTTLSFSYKIINSPDTSGRENAHHVMCSGDLIGCKINNIKNSARNYNIFLYVCLAPVVVQLKNSHWHNNVSRQEIAKLLSEMQYLWNRNFFSRMNWGRFMDTGHKDMTNWRLTLRWV